VERSEQNISVDNIHKLAVAFGQNPAGLRDEAG
jgi:hypothetical protein